MEQIKTLAQCDRGADLVSFLYGEVNDSEAADFQAHLQKCSACQTELADFGQVHQSMLSWRDEMLSGFVAPPPVPVRQKSALAALREFFDLSPLWMKGAVGLAVLVLMALAFVNVSQLRSSPAPVKDVVQSNGKYTEAELQKRIQEAREEWIAKQAPKEEIIEKTTPSSSRETLTKGTSAPKKYRSPLSKSEREQLAADLRLRSTDDDDLTLLEDRINKDF